MEFSRGKWANGHGRGSKCIDFYIIAPELTIFRLARLCSKAWGTSTRREGPLHRDFEHLLVKFSKAFRCEGKVAGEMQKHKYCLRENAPMRDLVGIVVRDAYGGIVTNGN